MFPPRLDFDRPGGGDPVDDGFDLAVIQNVVEGRHGRAIIVEVGRFSDAVFRYRHEEIPFMMPCMAACVMWRRGQQAIRVPDLPVRLAFEIVSMAGRAVNRVEMTPLRQVSTFQKDRSEDEHRSGRESRHCQDSGPTKGRVHRLPTLM